MALISPRKLRYDLYSYSYQENSNTPLVISILASLIERTLARNERIAKNIDCNETPDMTIQSYLERIFRYTRAGPPVYVVGANRVLVLLKRNGVDAHPSTRFIGVRWFARLWKKYFRIDMLKKFTALCFETDLFQLRDGHGGEIRVYLEAVRSPIVAAEIQGSDKGKNIATEGIHTMTEGDKGKNTVIERDKGKNTMTEDGERAHWVDWDRDDEDMRETEEWVVDSEDNLFDGDESVDYDEDDECFDENVDKDAEWAGILQDASEDEMRFDSDDHTDGDSPDEFDSQKNNDDDDVGKVLVFCTDDKLDPKFALRMKFSNKKKFREAVHSHTIMTRRNLVITKNDKRRIYARCKADGCSWHINAVKIRDELGFQIRESDPNRSAKGFRQDVMRQLRCNVSRGQAYATKRRCLQEIQGYGAVQYARLWDYAGALRNKNPGSTIIMNLEDCGFYVCFAAVKNGFLSGCRPFIGVDGCHLKGPHGGVLLTAEDLNIIRDDAYTFISDKQKGFLPAFEKVVPGIENRFCVRHFHGNMKNAGFKGLGYKKTLWKAKNTTTVSQFHRAIQDIADLDVRCLEWWQDKPASQWSKRHFSTYPKCDFLLNNLCESFNSCILEAREKPILTMLEWIREDRAERLWEGKKLCPKIKKIVDNNMKKAADCITVKSDDTHYEVQGFNSARYTVNLKEKTCSCRSWDLTNIPCNHAMSAISAQVLDLDDFVHECYHVDTFCKVYAPAIIPLDGLEMWEKTGYIPPVPPNFGRKKGRPARSRRLEPDEVRKGKKPATTINKLQRQRGKGYANSAAATEHVTTPVQQDEVIVNEDCPPVSQPEVVSQHETDDSFYPEFRIGARNVHRLLITTIMVASKYVEDMNYINSYFAHVGGLTTNELNKLEVEFLFLMKFKLHVNMSVYESYCCHLEREVSISGGYQIERTLRLYDLNKHTLLVSRDAMFHEDVFPYVGKQLYCVTYPIPVILDDQESLASSNSAPNDDVPPTVDNSTTKINLILAENSRRSTTIINKPT
ncbi:UNVERIFIED_CONTAM: Cyclin-U2-2 [Sesamum indicum]